MASVSKMNRVSKVIEDNPEYIDILSHIIQYENDNTNPDHSFIEGTDYDSCWTYKDVGVPPQTLYQMETKGLLDRVFDSNSTTSYAVKNRDEIETVVREIDSKFNDGAIEKYHQFPDEEELREMGVFDDVVGYEDAKWLLTKALSSDNIVNVLLVGPPGCGKTVFLRCINNLNGSSFVSGKNASGPGFIDEMFETKPRYMCIDELDDMENAHQQVLSDYTEEGILSETKGNNKRRVLRTNTKTFASANSTEKIIDQIENRFTDLHFEPYDLEDFIQVCVNILPKDYDQSESHAEEIAKAVWDIEGHANVRKAEDVAALSDGGDPEKTLRVLNKYSKSGSGTV